MHHLTSVLHIQLIFEEIWVTRWCPWLLKLISSIILICGFYVNNLFLHLDCLSSLWTLLFEELFFVIFGLAAWCVNLEHNIIHGFRWMIFEKILNSDFSILIRFQRQFGFFLVFGIWDSFILFESTDFLSALINNMGLGWLSAFIFLLTYVLSVLINNKFNILFSFFFDLIFFYDLLYL